MMSWSLVAEFLAFAMVTMIFLFFHDRSLTSSFRRRIFTVALFLSLLSIALNVLSVWTLANYTIVPYWAHMALNNCYFIINIFVATALAMYLFDHLFEFTSNRRYRIVAFSVLLGITLVYSGIIVSNSWNFLVFSIDDSGVYHRGPLNNLGYFTVLVETAVVLVCYVRYRKSVSRAVVRVMHVLPPLVILLLTVQFIFPDILLNGTIIAYTELIIFISFQSLKVEEDSLTRVGNRNSFCDEVDLRITEGQHFQVILVHLLNVEVVNSRYGYKKGDDLLVCVSRWLSRYAGTDRVFRFGNVSFASICRYNDENEAQSRLEDITKRFESDGWQLGTITCHIPACYVNMVYDGGMDWDSTKLVEYLVYMLAEAKKKAALTVNFSEKIVKTMERKKHLQSLIKENIEKKSFEVWYQPVYNCKKDGFTAAEALVRMRDDDGTIISPGEFIPIAEDDEIIGDITWIVMEQVCKFLDSHRDLPLDCISINLSAQQLDDDNLSENIWHLLNKYNISPDRIRLEITERLIHGDQKVIGKVMREMSGENIGFCLDDFGTGYSNFVSVMRLPFDFIKMDKSLFDDINKENKDKFIVSTIIALFHQIDLKVVAEGIEDQQQLNAVKDMGVDLIQGYIYARPMESALFANFCRGHAPKN